MDLARKIIADNRYLTLATIDESDVWIAPLAYVYDEEAKCFYFYSSKNSVHARHIEKTPNCAVSIYNSMAESADATGLQFKAKVDVVVEAELDKVLAFYFEKAFPQIEGRQKWQQPATSFYGTGIQRFFCVRPLNLFHNDVDGLVDCRREISLDTL